MNSFTMCIVVIRPVASSRRRVVNDFDEGETAASRSRRCAIRVQVHCPIPSLLDSSIPPVCQTTQAAQHFVTVRAGRTWRVFSVISSMSPFEHYSAVFLLDEVS